jgi:cyclopropane fatty-acyl-phospholipid synthase-like methyltransferase
VAAKIPERLSWAVETLAVQSDDRLLEIGCGHGIAVWLVCDRLLSGSITAIDRSQKMIEIAQYKNQQHIAAGKAIFHATALDWLDVASKCFNKIFAINVNVFWLKPARELAMIRAMLEPEGRLYLFYEPPDSSKSQAITDKVRMNLQQEAFSVREVLVNAHRVCIIATAETSGERSPWR